MNKNMEENETIQITEVSSDIQAEFTEAERVKKDVMSSGFAWTDREQLFYGRYVNIDDKEKEKKNVESFYSTGELATLILDSSCRIMAQMATGRFSSYRDTDISKVI